MSTMTYRGVGGYATDNVVEFNEYRQRQEMDMRCFVLTPVTEFAPVATPRPRRTHNQFGYTQFASTCLNLGVVAITFLLTAQLLAIL